MDAHQLKVEALTAARQIMSVEVQPSAEKLVADAKTIYKWLRVGSKAPAGPQGPITSRAAD